jgi:hypothetical protein
MAIKKMRGKSMAAVEVPVYKPTLYLEDNQVPKELIQAKPGETVVLQVKGKIQSRREEAGNHKAVTVEVQALSLSGKKKTTPKKKKEGN